MPSNHTKLINYLIGFCKNDPKWINPLWELKYKPRIIEQTISMSDGSSVTPDIILGTDRFGHILVCECKGGSTINKNQAAKYGKLTVKDLSRWLRLQTGSMLHDVCYVVFKDSPEFIQNAFPALVFSDRVEKHGKKFSQDHLEKAFSQSSDISRLSPPLSYYPFSSEDNISEITAYVLRAVVSLAQKEYGVPTEDAQRLDKILSETHKMYKVLSSRHKRELKKKIGQIVSELASKYPDFKDYLDGQRNGQAARSNFIATCQTILRNMESTTRLDDFSSMSP